MARILLPLLLVLLAPLALATNATNAHARRHLTKAVANGRRHLTKAVANGRRHLLKKSAVKKVTLRADAADGIGFAIKDRAKVIENPGVGTKFIGSLAFHQNDLCRPNVCLDSEKENCFAGPFFYNPDACPCDPNNGDSKECGECGEQCPFDITLEDMCYAFTIPIGPTGCNPGLGYVACDNRLLDEGKPVPDDACKCEQIECCCDPVLPAQIRPKFEDTYSIRPFKFEIKCLASGNWEDTLRGKLEGQEGSWAVYCGEIIDGGCEGIECNGAIGQWSCYASSDSDNTDQGGDGVASSIPCAFIALVEDRCWTYTPYMDVFGYPPPLGKCVRDIERECVKKEGTWVVPDGEPFAGEPCVESKIVCDAGVCDGLAQHAAVGSSLNKDLDADCTIPPFGTGEGDPSLCCRVPEEGEEADEDDGCPGIPSPGLGDGATAIDFWTSWGLYVFGAGPGVLIDTSAIDVDVRIDIKNAPRGGRRGKGRGRGRG